MSRPLTLLAAALWGALVFLAVFWVAFPSQVVADRLAYEVDSATRGNLELSLDRARPWWVGLAADNVIVSQRGDDGGSVPFFFSREAGIRTGLLGLIRRTPTLYADVALESGHLLVTADTTLAQGRVSLQALELEGDALGLDDLLALALRGGDPALSTTGSLDVEASLTLPDGFGSASGSLDVLGDKLSLDLGSDYQLPSVGPLGAELSVPVDELDIRLRGDDGAFEVTRAALVTSLIEVEATGTVTLDDVLGRSTIDLDLVVTLGDWEGTPVSAMRRIIEGQMAAAQWSDGTYHYEVAGVLGRLNGRDVRPVRDSSRTITRPTTTPTPSPRPDFPVPTSPREIPDRAIPSLDDRTVDPRTSGPTPLPRREALPVDEEEFLDDEEEFVAEEEAFFGEEEDLREELEDAGYLDGE